MKVYCDACEQEAILTRPAGPVALKDTLPRGWRPRQIDGRTYVLCDVCGNLHQFVGGLSPYLQERLNLPKNVEVEYPEHTDFSFRGKHT